MRPAGKTRRPSMSGISENVLMLRTNLATRPFYNERAAHLVLLLAGLLVLAVTVFNVSRIATLSARHAELRVQIERDEVRAAELSQQAAAVRRTIDAADLDRVVGAAREANTLIDQRTFSWTELFNRIEDTLPPDVMLRAVRPQIEEHGVRVTLIVVARAVEGIDTFIERLEGTGAFRHVLARQEDQTEDGLFRATIQGAYLAAGTPDDAPPAAGAAGRDAAEEDGRGEDED
jgi:Tfp pilus assembly protein PilN